MKIGNIYYNLEADLTEEQFKDTYRGKINIDLDAAWKIVKKHKKAVKSVKKKRK